MAPAASVCATHPTSSSVPSSCQDQPALLGVYTDSIALSVTSRSSTPQAD